MHRLEVSEDQLNYGGKAIVDSGTTDTYMTSRIASAFKETWKKITGKDYNHSAMKLTKEELESLPTIIIVIQGYEGPDVGDEPFGEPNDVPGWAGEALSPSFPKDVVLSIPASHYMEYDPDKEAYVARFYTEEGSGSVLGANAMMGHDVYFDIPRGRVGFAESDCDYAKLLETEGKSISVAPTTNTVSTKTEIVPEEEEQVEVIGEEPTLNDGAGNDESESSSYENPVPTEHDNALFKNKHPQDQNGSSTYSDLSGKAKDKAAEIIDDMKHECSSTECRGVAGFLIFSALVIVIAAIRRAASRRRLIRQYQEAELEISDLALNSDSDSEDGMEGGGYTDEPPMPPQLS